MKLRWQSLFSLVTNLGFTVSQFPLNGDTKAYSDMKHSLVIDKAERDREANKAENAIDFAELKRELREEKEEIQAYKERGSLMTPNGKPIPENANVGEQVIDPRTPRNFGNPFFRKHRVENNMEDDLSEFMEKEAAKLTEEEIAIIESENVTSIEELADVIQDIPILVVRPGPNIKNNDLSRLNDEETDDKFWKQGLYGKIVYAHNSRYIDADLGGLYDITTVTTWHVSGQQYYGLAVEISTNGEFNGEQVTVYDTGAGVLGPVETDEGLVINLPEPLLGRWIRHRFGRAKNTEYTAVIEMDVKGYEIKTTKTDDAWKRKKVWNYAYNNKIENYPFFLRTKDSPHQSIVSDTHAYMSQIVTTSNEGTLPKFQWMKNQHGLPVLKSLDTQSCFTGDSNIISNQAESQCMTLSGTSVMAESCDSVRIDQQWYFDHDQERIKKNNLQNSNICLEYNPSWSTLTLEGMSITADPSGQVVLSAFDNKDSQYWKYLPETEQIVNKDSGKCLDLGTANQLLYHTACYTGTDQKWYSDGVSIRSRHTGNWALTTTENHNFHAADYGTGNQAIGTTIFSTTQNPELVAKACSSSEPKQQWLYESGATIRQNGECLEENGGTYSVAACDGGNDQKFNVQMDCNGFGPQAQSLYDDHFSMSKYLPYPCPDENEITNVGQCAYVATAVEVASCDDSYTACDNPCDCFKRNGAKKQYRKCHKHCARSTLRSKVKCAKYQTKARQLKKLLEARHYERACNNQSLQKSFHILGDDRGPSKGVF